MARAIGLTEEDVSWVFYRNRDDVICGLRGMPVNTKKTHLTKLDKSLYRAIEERMSESFEDLLKEAHKYT